MCDDSCSEWATRAVSAAEKAIDCVIGEFIENPYLHRVEHCLHTRCIELLRRLSPLDERPRLSDSGYLMQLVHKEWPEKLRLGKKRRGNFDIGILSPQQFEGVDSFKAFRKGRIAPLIAIEIGLDYPFKHLKNDKEKLRNSFPEDGENSGYLLHLVRGREPNQQELELLIAPDARLKAACAFVNGEWVWRKLVGDRELTRLPSNAGARRGRRGALE